MTNKLPEGLFEIKNGPSRYDVNESVVYGKTVKITCEIPPRCKNEKIAFNQIFDVIFTGGPVEAELSNSWIGEIFFLEYNKRRQYYYDSIKRTGYIKALEN